MAADLDLVRRLTAAEAGLVVVATTRSDGSVQASVVNAGVLDDPETGEPCVGFVARGDARKLTLMGAAGRACVVARSGWEWVAVEGPVRILGQGTAGLPQLLRAVFTAAGGTHENWSEFDRVMADEHRAAVLVHPARITSN
jgi:hypothetical protein